MPGKIVNKTELAAITGKQLKTLTIWQNEGMPMEPDDGGKRENFYNTAEVIAWMIKRETKNGLDVNEERAKLASAQTEATILRNEQRKGSMISLPTAKTVAERAAFAIRQKIMLSDLDDHAKQSLLTDINGLGSLDFMNLEGADDEEQEEGAEEEAGK